MVDVVALRPFVPTSDLATSLRFFNLGRDLTDYVECRIKCGCFACAVAHRTRVVEQHQVMRLLPLKK